MVLNDELMDTLVELFRTEANTSYKAWMKPYQNGPSEERRRQAKAAIKVAERVGIQAVLDDLHKSGLLVPVAQPPSPPLDLSEALKKYGLPNPPKPVYSVTAAEARDIMADVKFKPGAILEQFRANHGCTIKHRYEKRNADPRKVTPIMATAAGVEGATPTYLTADPSSVYYNKTHNETYDVFLDGIKLYNCIEADVKAGWVRVKEERVNDEFATRQINGVVTLVARIA